jgi:hypothetical protein
VSAAYEFYAYLDLDLLLILLLVQAQHILGWHEACCLVSEIWLHGYFWHVSSFQLNLWNMCFSCGSEGVIIRSILITQKQCKITASLMILLCKHRLHFHFPFTSNLNFIYKLIAELLAMQWIHLVRWLYLASSFFQNMLLLILLLMFDIFSNKVWGLFFYGKLQCCSFNKHFIMELIPHQMHELHLVFGHVNPFLFVSLHSSLFLNHASSYALL